MIIIIARITKSLSLREFASKFAREKEVRMVAFVWKKDILFIRKQRLRVQSGSQPLFVTSKYIYVTHTIVIIGALGCTVALIGCAFVYFRSILQLQEKDRFSFQKYFACVSIFYHLVRKKMGTIFCVVVVFVSVTLMPNVRSQNNEYSIPLPSTSFAALFTSNSFITENSGIQYLPIWGISLNDNNVLVRETKEKFSAVLDRVAVAGGAPFSWAWETWLECNVLSNSDLRMKGEIRTNPVDTLQRCIPGLINKKKITFDRLKTLVNLNIGYLKTVYGTMFTELARGLIEIKQGECHKYGRFKINPRVQNLYEENINLVWSTMKRLQAHNYSSHLMVKLESRKDVFCEVRDRNNNIVKFLPTELESLITNLCNAAVNPKFGGPVGRFEKVVANNWLVKIAVLQTGSDQIKADNILSPFTLSIERCDTVSRFLVRFNNAKDSYVINRFLMRITEFRLMNVTFFYSLHEDTQAKIRSYKHRYFYADELPKPNEISEDLRGAECLLESLAVNGIQDQQRLSYSIPKEQQKEQVSSKRRWWGGVQQSNSRLQVNQLSLVKFDRLAKRFSIERKKDTFENEAEARAQIDFEIDNISALLGNEDALPRELMVKRHEFNQPGGIFDILSSKMQKSDSIAKQKEYREQMLKFHSQPSINTTAPDAKLDLIDGFSVGDYGFSLASGSYSMPKFPISYTPRIPNPFSRKTGFGSLNLSLLSSLNKRIIKLPKSTRRNFVIVDGSSFLPYFLGDPNVAKLSVGFAFDLKTLNPEERQMFKSNLKQLTSNRYRLQFHKGNPSLKQENLNWKHMLQLMQVKQNNISFYLNTTQQNVDAGRLDSATLTPCNNEISLTFCDLAMIITMSIILGILGQQVLHKIHENKNDKNDKQT